MIWVFKKFFYTLRRSLFFCLLFVTLVIGNGCQFADAMIEQSYDSDRSMILFGHDFKYITGSYLGEHSPEIVPKWLEERKSIEKSQSERKKDIALPNGGDYFKFFGMAFSGWQTGGISVIGLLTFLGALITKRKHEQRVEKRTREKIEEEDLRERGKVAKEKEKKGEEV